MRSKKIAATFVILSTAIFAPATGSTTSQDASFSAAARAVEAAEKKSISIAQRGKKRKSSERHHYDDETRTATGKHAIKYGNKTMEKYSRSLGFDLPEATVQNFKRELEKQIKSGKRYDEARISVQKRGRHLLLPEEMDSSLSKFVQSLRLAGSPVSSSIIIIVAARGIVVHKDQFLLKEYGGPIALQKSWAFSFLRRYGYVKHKGISNS